MYLSVLNAFYQRGMLLQHKNCANKKLFIALYNISLPHLDGKNGFTLDVHGFT